MNSPCLCLSRNMAPINMYERWQDAVTKIDAGRAEVIASYPDKHLRSWKQAREAPAIIRLLYFAGHVNRRNHVLRLSRKNIWLRDQGKCSYCRTFLPIQQMHWDHIVPRDQGGTSTWLNLCCACSACNSHKSNRTPAQAGMHLWRLPYAPKYNLSLEREMVMKLRSMKNFPHSKWLDYVYFDVELDK